MQFNQEQSLFIYQIWKPYYSIKDSLTLEKILDDFSYKNDEKDIKKIRSTLDFFSKEGIEFKSLILDYFEKHTNKYTSAIPFSYCILFDYLYKNKLISLEEIPLERILDGTDSFIKSHCKRKNRFHFEHQINLILSFDANEYNINKILDLYSQIRGTYQLDLPEQKKLLKNFNAYAGSFVKTLSADIQKSIFNKLDIICSGINNQLTNEIDSELKEEFSFRFIISISNTLKDNYFIFNNVKSIVEVVIERIKDDNISQILFKEINTQSSIGSLKFQYAFFSEDKSCIKKYSSYFREFNDILTQDAMNKNLKKDDYYVDLFNKICLKNKLSEQFPEKSQSDKKLKI